MLSIHRLSATCALFLCFPGALAGQQADTCPIRTIPVNVRDAQGTLVTGLDQGAYRGSLRGQQIVVRGATVETGPKRTLLLLDVSGSMTGSSRTWELVRLLTGDFATSGPKGNEVALVTFATGIQDTVAFSQDLTALVAKLRSLQNVHAASPNKGGQTGLFDALLYATTLFGDPRPGDVIYLISDGGDNQSRHPRPEALRAAVEKGIRVYSFLIRLQGFVTEEGRRGPKVLEEFAQQTGGLVADAPSDIGGLYDLSPRGRGELSRQLQVLYAHMSTFYNLEIQLPSQLVKPTDWKLEITDERGKRRKDVLVTYPHELAPCKIEARSSN